MDINFCHATIWEVFRKFRWKWTLKINVCRAFRTSKLKTKKLNSQSILTNGSEWVRGFKMCLGTPTLCRFWRGVGGPGRRQKTIPFPTPSSSLQGCSCCVYETVFCVSGFPGQVWSLPGGAAGHHGWELAGGAQNRGTSQHLLSLLSPQTTSSLCPPA